jgi:hypothetical protein
MRRGEKKIWSSRVKHAEAEGVEAGPPHYEARHAEAIETDNLI